MSAREEHRDENERALHVLVKNRRSRSIPYAFMIAAATCSLLIDRPPSVEHQFTDELGLLFSIFWIISSLLCFFGTATEYWILEWWGLLPMYLSFVTFGAAAIGFGFVTGWSILPAALSLLALGGIFRSLRKDVNVLWAWSGGRT